MAPKKEYRIDIYILKHKRKRMIIPEI